MKMEQKAFRIRLTNGMFGDVFITASKEAMDAARLYLEPSMSDPQAGRYLGKSSKEPPHQWYDNDAWYGGTANASDTLKLSDIERTKKQILANCNTYFNIEAFKGATKADSAIYAMYYDPAYMDRFVSLSGLWPIPQGALDACESAAQIPDPEPQDELPLTATQVMKNSSSWKEFVPLSQSIADARRRIFGLDLVKNPLPNFSLPKDSASPEPPEVDPMEYTRKLFR